MSFKDIPANISFPKEEEKILELWKEIDAFQTSLKKSEGRKPFSFYDGPPFATGLPHYGHILAGTIKVCHHFMTLMISHTTTHSIHTSGNGKNTAKIEKRERLTLFFSASSRVSYNRILSRDLPIRRDTMSREDSVGIATVCRSSSRSRRSWALERERRCWSLVSGTIIRRAVTLS